MPVQQFDYTEEEKQAFRDNPQLIDDIRYDKQYWDNIYRFNKGIINPDSPEMQMIEDICRDYLEASIQDSELREKLRPDYRAACKRLVYNWHYYDCVQKPNVFVETGSIDRVMGSGIQMKDGTFHELDILVLATGFHADKFIKPTSVIGRDGLSLDTFWTPRPSAHYAVTLPRFPNMFMLNGPTGPVGNFSLIDIAERQWGYVDQLLDIIHSGEADTVEPKISAFEDYEKRRIDAAQKTIFSSGCTSWYLDKTGVPMTWPWGYQDFVDAMHQPVISEYDIKDAS
jgi:cation diffusion facilitator CzcD-associated flavoprotein CzcO